MTLDSKGLAPVDLVDITRTYYDSVDADTFYRHIWGGDDIHIGLYDAGDLDIAQASRKTIERMLACLPRPTAATRVVDLGSGYCGAARHLVARTGCHVTALNLSARENARAAALNAAAGLGERIDIVEGSYEQIPAGDAAFDLAWSQDAILHSARKDVVFAEVARILTPGGDFIFTDPMESDDVAEGRVARAALQPVLDRIHLAEMGSSKLYRELAERVGLEVVAIHDLSHHLPVHYAAIRRELDARRDALSAEITPDFVDRMSVGLDHWIQAGDRGHLAWGILHFRKPGPT